MPLRAPATDCLTPATGTPRWRPGRARALAGALLLVGLAGCTAPPLPALRPPTPAQWRTVADTPAAPPTDLHGWWHAFGDAGLDRLVDQALARNLDVAQALEHLRAARAMQRRADERFRPELHAKTEDAIDPDASASFFVAGFDAVWELDLFGRGTAVQRTSQGELAGAAADLRAAQVTLVAEVVRNWLELRAAQQQQHWLTQIRDARRQQSDLLAVRAHLQLASAQDTAQAQAALAQAEADLSEPRASIATSAQQLAVLLGQSEPDPAWFDAAPPPTLGRWHLAQAPADLLRSRPEIAHAQAEVLRAAGAAGLARADRYPRVALGGSLVWSTNLTTHRRTDDNALASLGPIIDIPLFDWGMRAAQAHASEHELKASVLAYRQAVLQGVAEVETALARVREQDEYERHCADALRALGQADAIVARRVALKLASPAERAQSTIARDQAQLALAQARTRRGLAFVALFKALGGAPLPAVDTSALAQEPR